MIDSKVIKYVTYNCNGFKSNSPYIIQLTKQFDCIFINKTWITEAEKYLVTDTFSNRFISIFTPAKQNSHGRPYGGNILFLKKKYFDSINIIAQEDFVTSITANCNNSSLLISGVYLQSLSSKEHCVDIYRSQLNNISGTLERFCNVTEFIIMGDFQCFPTQQTRTCSTNLLSKHLARFISETILHHPWKRPCPHISPSNNAKQILH